MAVKDRYGIVAIVLHWTIALLIFWMIWIGWWMTSAIDDPEMRATAFKAFQFHKSLGLTILALSPFRLIWRLTHKTPPLPAHMPGWEKFLARATHVGFYALIIVIPLAGWAYVSAGWNAHIDMPFSAPTIWFGLFEVPHIPFIANLNDSARRAAAHLAMGVHEKLAWAALILAGIHVAAALKHHIFDKDAVLHHMAPFVKAPTSKAQNADTE